MDDSDVIILCGIVIALAIVVAFLLSMKKQQEAEAEAEVQEVIKRIKVTDRPDLIQDDKVTVALVEEKLKLFTPSVVANRKNGFTEKDIQVQLDRYFKDIFQTVTREHAIESKSGKAIDFDLGNGKVGMEIKLASEVMKEGGWDRAIGQISKYLTLRYKTDNLMLVIAGFDDDLRNSILSEIEDYTIEKKCTFCFISAGDRSNLI